MIGLTYEQLIALKPCSDSLKRVTKLMGGARKWNGTSIDAATARAAGATLDDILWSASALSRTDKDAERRLRLWTADCAARVLDIFEREFPDDDRPRNAIIEARMAARAAAGAAEAEARAQARAAAAAAVATDAAEGQWQFDRLILWLSDNEPEDWPLPEQKREDVR